MQVILLQKVRNLGDLGEQVKVRSGYGRNYLIPKGVALAATPANLKVYEERKGELLAASKDRMAQARGRADAINGKSFTVAVRTSDEGKLYGSVGPQEIVDAAQKEGYELDASEVALAEGAIRQTGYYTAVLHLHAEVEAEIEVVVAQLTDMGVNLPAREAAGEDNEAPAEGSEADAAPAPEDLVDEAGEPVDAWAPESIEPEASEIEADAGEEEDADRGLPPS